MKDFLTLENEIDVIFKEAIEFDSLIICEGNEEIIEKYEVIVIGNEDNKSLLTRIYDGIVNFIRRIFRLIQKLLGKLKAFISSLFTNNDSEKIMRKTVKETERIEKKAGKELANIEDQVCKEVNEIYDNMDNLKNMDISTKIVQKIPSIKSYKAMAYLASLADHKRPSLGLVNEILGNVNTMAYNILHMVNMLIGTSRGIRDNDIRQVIDLICNSGIPLEENAKAITMVKLTLIELYDPLIDAVNIIAARNNIYTTGTRLLIRAEEDLKKKKLLHNNKEYIFFNTGPDYLEYFTLKGGRAIDVLKILNSRKEYLEKLSIIDLLQNRDKVTETVNEILSDYADSIYLCLFDFGKVEVPISDRDVVNFVKQLTVDTYNDFVSKIKPTLKVYDKLVDLRKELDRVITEVETYAIREMIEKLENCSIDRQGEDTKDVRLGIGKLIKNYELMVLTVLNTINKLSNNLLVTNNTVLKNIARMRDLINEIVIELTVYK